MIYTTQCKRVVSSFNIDDRVRKVAAPKPNIWKGAWYPLHLFIIFYFFGCKYSRGIYVKLKNMRILSNNMKRKKCEIKWLMWLSKIKKILSEIQKIL